MIDERMQTVTDIKQNVDNKLARLSTKLPEYTSLTDEARQIVDRYMSKVDLSDPKTIDTFGRDEVEKIYGELDQLIGNLKTHDVSIDEMFTDLMLDVNSNGKDDERGFLETLKDSKSITKAVRTLLNRPKQMAEVEKYRRAKVMDNIDVIREKLEEIRSEIALNAQKLEIMAQNSADQYQNIQYQMLALSELSRQLEQAEGQENTELSLAQINSSIQNTGIQRRIARKMENLQGVAINAATKAIMARLVAQYHQELASDYDQDLSTLLPELKGVVVMAQANDSLIQSADVHDKFVQGMNEMLRNESKRSKEAIERVQAISGGSVIDVETAKTLTQDVLDVVASLKKSQEEVRPTNEAFTELFEQFRVQLDRTINGEINDMNQTQKKRKRRD